MLRLVHLTIALHRLVQTCGASGFVVALLCFAGCATSPAPPRSSLARQVAVLDAEYRALGAGGVARYNAAMRALALQLEQQSPGAFASEIARLGVAVDIPRTTLPLAQCHVVRNPARPVDPRALGVPMMIEYETKRAPFHPPEGMLIPATAVYLRGNGRARISLLRDHENIELKGTRYSLAIDHAAPGRMLARRARRFGKSGFMSMIRPARIPRRPQVYLLDEYDPHKIPLFMVHGLQSTPVAFANLVNALRADPEIRARYQIWQFHYASGTPLLVNALTLREELARTIRYVDPRDAHAATRRLVVLGHSMGGLMSHTLVSSSGDRLWRSLFTRPRSALAGDRDALEQLERVMFFPRNPRVARVIFMATPHRGSVMADAWVGRIARSLSRVPAILDTGLNSIAQANREAMTPEGAAFYNGESFSGVRTLSPRNPSLIALSNLPIAVPFHSIMAQKNAGPRERGTDGVVQYARSHLDGAASELVVPGGHNVFNQPEAVAEVIRILRLELREASSSVQSDRQTESQRACRATACSLSLLWKS